MVFAFLPASSGAQELTGPLLSPGLVRLEFGPIFEFAEARFGERTVNGELLEEEEPLGFDFSSSRVDAGLFPGLAALEEALRLADPSMAVDVSMGVTDVFMTQDRVTVPLGLEVGVTPWLSVGGRVPFSRRRSELLVRASGEGANAGVSPSVTDPSAVSDFLGQMRAATQSMASARDGICAAQGTGSPACASAQAAFNDAESFRIALQGAYIRSPGFALENTAAGTALLDKMSVVRGAALDLGVGSMPSALPLATAEMDGAAFQSFISDESGTIRGEPLADWRSVWEPGDAEVFAHARLLGSSPAQDSADGGLAYELGVGALLRLGTGEADSPDNFVDIGSGDGTQDVEGRLFLNLQTGARVGLWSDVRYGVQGSTVLPRRITAANQPLAPVDTRQSVEWTPGAYLIAELSPRLFLTDEVAITGMLRHRRKAADEYALVDPTVGLDAALLEEETEQRATELGIGVAFNSLVSESGRGMEARFQYTTTLAGGGGRTHKWSRVEVGLRFFRRFWGRPAQ